MTPVPRLHGDSSYSARALSRPVALSAMDKRHYFDSGPVSSPLWSRALENALTRFRNNLEADDDLSAIIQSGAVTSFADVTEQNPLQFSREQSATASIKRLEPILSALGDLSAVAAVAFGADTVVTALLWGSLRLCISLASSAADTLQNVLEMLEDIASRLPRLIQYEKTLPMDYELEQSLLDLYTEIVCFCARAISFLRRYPHVKLRRHAWAELQGDFSRTMQVINRRASKVDAQADLAKMRANPGQYKEVVECMQEIANPTGLVLDSPIRCNVPIRSNYPTAGREDVLQQMEASMSSNDPGTSLKTILLHGMGGVGKSRAAQEFIRTHQDQFSVIIWIRASTPLTIHQSFESAVETIKSSTSAQNIVQIESSPAGALKWLQETDLKWLLVFDGAETAASLRHVWPTYSRGTVLVTCRRLSIAQAFSQSSIELRPLDLDAGAHLFLRASGYHEPNLEPGTLHLAKQASAKFGGLPLALVQAGAFTAARKLTLSRFLSLYEKNSERIDAKRSDVIQHENTLATLWEMPLSSLSEDAQVLQQILAFAQPDAVHEEFLLDAARGCNLTEPVLMDEICLQDAEEELLEAALIRKDRDTESISTHPLIQTAALRMMSAEVKLQRATTFVRLLNKAFPDTWTSDVGHQHSSWRSAAQSLPHVIHLADLVKRQQGDIKPSDMSEFGELLLRCSWYLYERESYDLGWNMVHASLATISNRESLAFASATDLSGLILLDLNKPQEAMTPFEEALALREKLLGKEDPFVASSLNNIAMAHMELGQLQLSEEYHEKALKKRLNTDRVGNSLSNFASLRLRQGRPEEAEKLLKQCPSLQNFTDDTFLATENPRYVGDMVLLSRIRSAQNLPGDALRLAAKALTFRRRTHGDRYKSCDSMLDVAQLLVKQGSDAAAVDLLNEVAHIARTLTDGEGFEARAEIQLYSVLTKTGDAEAGNRHKARAEDARRRALGKNVHDCGDASDFGCLTPFMLW